MARKSLPVITCDIVTGTPELTLADLCRATGLPKRKIIAYVQEGIVAPAGRDETEWRFSRLSLIETGRARRLERDFGLNSSGTALVIDLLDQIRDLETRLRRLENS